MSDGFYQDPTVEETWKDRHDAIDAIQNQAPVGWNGTPYSHPLKDKNLCGWCHQPIKIQIFMGTGYCCEDHRKLLAHETGVANPNPKHNVIVDKRLTSCIENWPECEEGQYNPACCRFPKVCSPYPYEESNTKG